MALGHSRGIWANGSCVVVQGKTGHLYYLPYMVCKLSASYKAYKNAFILSRTTIAMLTLGALSAVTIRVLVGMV